MAGRFHLERWRPTRLAGTRSRFSTEFTVHPDWDRSRLEIVACLLRGAAQLAETTGAASLGVLWLTSAAAREMAGCRTRPEFLLLASPNCANEVTCDSFEGFLDQLSPSRRRSARRERERFQKSGLCVEFSDPGSGRDEVAPPAHHSSRSKVMPGLVQRSPSSSRPRPGTSIRRAASPSAGGGTGALAFRSGTAGLVRCTAGWPALTTRPPPIAVRTSLSPANSPSSWL